MLDVTIHANSGISWHKRYAKLFQMGFRYHGIEAKVSPKGYRQSDISVLFGPNYWKRIERDGGTYLMVNRVLISTNPQHVHDVVALSWNGFNGRGTFCVDDYSSDKRLSMFIDPVKDVKTWRKSGDYLLLCGQADLGRCGKFASLGEFYNYVKGTAAEPVVLRPHPSQGQSVPLQTHFHMSRAAAVLNSTVAVDAMLAGVPVISFDEGNPVHSIAGHTLAETMTPDRMPLFRYMAHCQHFAHEIGSGDFWEQLWPIEGPRLCDYGK